MLKRSLVAIALCLLATSGAEAASFRIATGEYPPFTSSSMKHNGYVNHIIDRASEEVGIDLQFQFLPWARSLELAERGDYAASSYWFYTAERDKKFFHVGPVSKEPIVFFHRKDRHLSAWSSLDDLTGLKIGATNGYTYSKSFWEAANSGTLTVDVVADDETNIKKLIAGRIDLFVAGKLSAWHLINEQFASQRDQLTTLEKPLTVQTGYLVVSRQAPDAEAFASSLQRGLDLIREQGLIDQFTQDLVQGHY
ncbi:MAG: transporter substrate-binding domain-containing protein [Pseudomonadota bacterium]